MESFKLYVGDGRSLTAAGWLTLVPTAAAVFVVGYCGSAWLADSVRGTGSTLQHWRMEILAGPSVLAGAAVWRSFRYAFRAAGFPLIAEDPVFIVCRSK